MKNRNTLIQKLLTHRSVRKFKSIQIEDYIIKDIISCAIRASNTGNMQIYNIIITSNPELREELCVKAHFNQVMVRQAPLILTFCADLNRFSHWYKLNNAKPEYNNFLSFYTASVDAVIAAQNACIAAEAHGIGICYLGTTNYNADKIIEILKLPELVVPVTSVVMGYPDEEQPLTDRLPEDAVVHYETYNGFSDEKIKRLYDERDNSEETRNLLEINKLENLAKIFTEKRYSGENNRYFSKSLLKVIEGKGFMNNG